nr:PREDICTED: nascent polypeptide-associated complex subunit alpha, muscle-specific form-like [Linepithema humile]
MAQRQEDGIPQPWERLGDVRKKRERSPRASRKIYVLTDSEDDDNEAPLRLTRPPRFTAPQRQDVDLFLRDILDRSPMAAASEAAALADEIEAIRSKSTSIRGDWSGRLKKDSYLLKEIVLAFGQRLADSGGGELSRLQRELETLREEVIVLRREKEEMRREMRTSRWSPSPPSVHPPVPDPSGTQPEATGAEVDRVHLALPPQSGDWGMEIEEPSGGGDLSPPRPPRAPSPPPPLPPGITPAMREMLEGVATIFKDGMARMSAVLSSLNERVADLEAARAPSKQRPSQPPPQPRPPTSGAVSRSAKRRESRKRRAARLADPPLGTPADGGPDSGAGVSVPPVSALAPSYAEATRSKRGGKSKPAPPPPTDGKAKAPTEAVKKREALQRAKRRLPKTAAVMISVPPTASLSEVMSKAKSSIKLEDLDIKGVRARTTLAGNFLIAIPGVGAEAKADALAREMRKHVGDEAKISRPCTYSELRLRSVEMFATAEDIAAAIATHGGCQKEDVRVGPLRPPRGGNRVVWVRCPSRAAMKIAALQGLQIIWATAKADLLPARPTRCYRCLARGHTQQQCPSKVDRTRCCFNCGGEGHGAGTCKAPPRCPVCADRGKESGHRAGAQECPRVPPVASTAKGAAGSSAPFRAPASRAPRTARESSARIRGVPRPSRPGSPAETASVMSDLSTHTEAGEKRPRPAEGSDSDQAQQLPAKKRAGRSETGAGRKPGPRSRTTSRSRDRSPLTLSQRREEEDLSD